MKTNAVAFCRLQPVPQRARRGLLFLLAALVAAVGVYGKGNKEAAAPPINDTWTLCVTNFDVSELPQPRAVLGRLVEMYIADELSAANTRLWTSEEAAYYTDAARLKTESEAAKKLAAKLTERDKLIFLGDDKWAYKQKLKKVDSDIEALRFELAKAKADAPLIATSPSVKLTEGNIAREFPVPPRAGLEYYFCASQKADAFLSGNITEYFNRISLEISLWSVYAKGVTYTDSVVFSAENVKDGVKELADRLFDYISGLLPAWIQVKTDPPNAVVIVGDRVKATNEAMDFTPGKVSVTAFAEDHETFETTVDLREGERSDVSIILAPLPMDIIDVSVKDGSEAALYDGGLYAGKTPTKLQAPSGKAKNLSVETPDGKVAQTVFRVSDTPVIFTPKPPPEQDRTNKARRKFYSAYGRFWLALPLAVLSIGLNNTIVSAYNIGNDPKLLQEQQAVYWTSMGLSVLMGLFLGESVYRIGRYVWEANKEASPLIKKAEVPKDEPSELPANEAFPAGSEAAGEAANEDAGETQDAVNEESSG
jgi:hypothetical protein